MKAWLIAATAALALGAPALAEASPLSGAWRLSAKVASVPFNLICRFDSRPAAPSAVPAQSLTVIRITR